MKINIIIILVCSLLYLVGCSNAQQTGKVIAEVNDSKLTYEYLLDQFPQEYRSSITENQLSNAIESWIETELLYQEALKHNIDKDKQIKNIIAHKRKEIIAAKFADISIVANIDIKDEIIDSVYYSQKNRFMVSEELFHLGHIVLINKNAADAVYNRLVKGDNFAELAVDYSEDPETIKNNGDIGLISKSSLEDNMVDEISKIKIGQFTKPLKSQSGYYHIFIL